MDHSIANRTDQDTLAGPAPLAPPNGIGRPTKPQGSASKRVQSVPVPACQHPEFPLRVEASTGQWLKKIRGVNRRFGSVNDDPTGEQAWEKYKLEREFWEAGQNPRLMARAAGTVQQHVGVTEILDHWLIYRDSLVNNEDPELRIDRRTFDESAYAVRRFLEIMDEIADRHADPYKWMPPDWAKIRARLGQKKDGSPVSPSTKGTRISSIRMAFQWWTRQQNPQNPRLPNWGECFASVGEEIKEEYRYDYQQEHGQRVFETAEARMILECVQVAADRAGLNINNASGHRGVSERPDGRFEAYIVRRISRVRRKIHLGVFDTAEGAAEAYRKEAERIGSGWQRRLVIGSKLFCAVTHLAANTGAYSRDIAALRMQDLRLSERYLERKRTKTKALWQAMLWPETVVAIEEYLKVMPNPASPEHAEIVFLTSEGLPVNLDREAIDENGKYKYTARKDTLRGRMRRLLLDLGIKNKGVNFGAWRHTFRSLASSALGVRKEDLEKFDAINRTMAHRIPGSANRYVHLRREQLQPIADVVREQIWPERVEDEKAEAKREEQVQKCIGAASQAGPHLRLVS